MQNYKVLPLGWIATVDFHYPSLITSGKMQKDSEEFEVVAIDEDNVAMVFDDDRLVKLSDYIEHILKVEEYPEGTTTETNIKMRSV